MTRILARGVIRAFGDDVNTDYIVPSRRKKETIDPERLRHFMFEDIEPDFFASLTDSTILCAGTNFGCGSAMEVAVTVPISAGVRAVVARSFARTYQRNAINNGLLTLKADTSALPANEEARIVEDAGEILVEAASGVTVRCDPMPEFVIDMIRHGGLLEYLKAHGRFPEQRA
ncbi:MAG: alpha-IPM isomerase [Salinarimonadaceae bacterium]|nr:MAG: alpha-IPM isomerase [Salinarimonadaceae bacterium]